MLKKMWPRRPSLPKILPHHIGLPRYFHIIFWVHIILPTMVSLKRSHNLEQSHRWMQLSLMRTLPRALTAVCFTNGAKMWFTFFAHCGRNIISHTVNLTDNSEVGRLTFLRLQLARILFLFLLDICLSWDAAECAIACSFCDKAGSTKKIINVRIWRQKMICYINVVLHDRKDYPKQEIRDYKKSLPIEK
jgi:hypothetical protein